jgi:hypothetical protein
MAVVLTESRWSTWRMPTGDESVTGIWARRYYVPDSKMATLADSGRGDAMSSLLPSP